MATLDILKPWFTRIEHENLDKTITYLVGAFLIFMLIFALGAGGNIADLFSIQINTIILFSMLVLTWAVMDSKPQIYVSFGEKEKAYLGVILGALIGVVLISKSLSISVPFASLPFSFTSPVGFILIVYTALIVPIVEEKFFGRTLPFIINGTFRNEAVSIAITSAVFAGFHLIAYGANLPLMTAAFMFRVVALVGNGYLKTGVFGDAMHYMNNILYVISRVG